MNLAKKTIFFIFYFLALFPIIGFNIESFGGILFLIIPLLIYFNNFKKADLKFIIPASLFYLFTIITLFYTDNLQYGVKEVTRGVSIIILPITFSLLKNHFTKQHITTFLRIYVLALVLFGVYLIYHIVDILELYNLNAISLAFEKSNFKYTLLGETYKNIHPSYFSAGLILGIFICLENFFSFKKQQTKVISIAIIIFFLFLLFLLRVRISLIALFITIPIYLFILLKSPFKRVLMLVSTFSLLFIFGVFIKENSGFRKAIYNEIIMVKKIVLGKEVPIQLKKSRINIYKSALSIIKENPVLGVGIGDVNDNLKAKYVANDLKSHYETGISNSHNQYMHYALVGGMIGFLIFVYCIGYNLYYAVFNKDYLYMSFLLLFSIVILTENFLNRIHGIFFFALFNSIFHYRNKYLITK